MNPNLIKRMFPRASASLLAANANDYGTTIDAQDTGQAAEPQRATRDDSLAAAQTKAGDRGRFLVRIVSVRKRLLDEDNLVGKYHCDLLRYSGILPDDAPGICKIETTQRKAAKGEAEFVEIEIFAPMTELTREASKA